MNHHKQEQLRTRLIKAGLWDATAQYNPARSWIALEELSERVQKRLANSASLFVYPLHGGRQAYQVILSFKEDEDLIIGFGNDIYEAICTAALSLPAFLAKHPKYATQEIKDICEIGVTAGDQSTLCGSESCN